MKLRRNLMTVSTLCIVALAGTAAVTSPEVASHPTIAVVFMENHSATDVVGNKNMPYLNSLLALGTRFTNYKEGDATGPSLPDYLGFASGSRCGASTDNVSAGKFGASQGCPTTLWNQLEAAGFSWSVQEDAMDVACSSKTNYANHGLDTPYAMKHNPAVPFDSIWSNKPLCQAHVTNIISPPSSGVSFVTPGICNDQHGSGSSSYTDCKTKTAALDKRGDTWLKTHIGPFISAGIDVFITYDEKGVLYAVGVGPSFTAGTTISTPVTHYSLLAGIEDAYGLTRLNNAASATPIVF